MESPLTAPSPAFIGVGQRSGRFVARPGQVAYGYPIGMLCAQWNIAFIPAI